MSELVAINSDLYTTVPSAGDRLADEAVLYLGSKSMKYKGPEQGMSPETWFDCSGFVTHLLEKLEFPKDENIRHANEYFDRFGILVHDGLQKRGDLVFFSRRGIFPTHVGIMVNSDEYVHAPGRDGTVVEKAELKREPIPMHPGQIYNINPIGFKRLAVSQGRWNTIN